MEVHGNARLTPHGRTLTCSVRDDGWTVEEAAEAAGCSERTCYRWLARFDAGQAMTDRSSRPHSIPGRTPEKVVELIEQMRRCCKTSVEIAAALDMPTSTVCAVLKRLGLQRLSKLEPPEPPSRYCRRHPGELGSALARRPGRVQPEPSTGPARPRSRPAPSRCASPCADRCRSSPSRSASLVVANRGGHS